jgi:hypothetical protein
MRVRWLGILVLVAAPAAAQPYCGQIACIVPPVACCSAQCWTCGGGFGCEDPGTLYQSEIPGCCCDNPCLITVGDWACECLNCAQSGGAFESVALATPMACLAFPGVGLRQTTEGEPFACRAGVGDWSRPEVCPKDQSSYR